MMSRTTLGTVLLESKFYICQFLSEFHISKTAAEKKIHKKVLIEVSLEKLLSKIKSLYL